MYWVLMFSLGKAELKADVTAERQCTMEVRNSEEVILKVNDVWRFVVIEYIGGIGRRSRQLL